MLMYLKFLGQRQGLHPQEVVEGAHRQQFHYQVLDPGWIARPPVELDEVRVATELVHDVPLGDDRPAAAELEDGDG